MSSPRNSLEVPVDAIGKLSHGLPYATYSERQGINATGLKDVLKSPGHYRALSLAPTKATDSMIKGTLTHLAVLEPERFADVAKTKSHVTFPAAEGEPEQRVTLAAYEMAEQMAAGVARNEVAKWLLSKGHAEVSAWWMDPVHDLLCKGRVDFVSEAGDGKPIALDLKTAKDADKASFARAAEYGRYDLQAAHYCEAGRGTGAFDPDRFAFVVVENHPPFWCVVYFVGKPAEPTNEAERFLTYGSEWREYAMRIYKKCRAAGAWPFPMAEQLQLSTWAKTPQELIDKGELLDV